MRKHIVSIVFILNLSGVFSQVIAQAEQSLDAELSVARTNVYVNETIEITLTIRSSGINIGQDIIISSMPAKEQLLQIGEYRELAPSISVANGTETRTRRFVGDFRPLTAGKMILSPELRLTLLTRRRSLFGTSIMHHSQRSLRVKPLNLSVKAIPYDTAPAGFEGAVGSFSFDVEVSPRQVQIGDLINITSTIRGKGYLDDPTPIGIRTESGFKTYDAKMTQSTPAMRQFLQTIVVTNTNTTAIPSISFTYFDPEKSKYITKHSAPISIKFHKKEDRVIEQFRPDDDRTQTSSTNGNAGESVPDNPASISKGIGKEETQYIVSTEQPLYFAPSFSSLITLDLPASAQVELLGKYKQWCKVEHKENRGWIPLQAIHTDK